MCLVGDQNLVNHSKMSGHTDIYGSTRDIVEFRPPLEVASSYPILEDKAYKNP